VRFAATSRPMFEVLYESGIDKTRHPEIEAAKTLDQVFLDCVRALADGDEHLASELAEAVEAVAHGHAMMLLDSGPSQDAEAVELAAERTARAVRALIESRRLLGQPSWRPVLEN